MTTLWLIRHGEAHVNQPNPDGTYSPIDRRGLTERGVEQAILLRDRLVRDDVRPDAVITSSFLRAQQTASIVCERLGIEPQISHEVQEWRPGNDAEVIPMGEALESWNRILAGGDHNVRLTPGSESHNEFLLRADRALAEIANDHADRTVWVFTHGGVIGRSFVTFLDLPPQRSLLGIRSRHTSITEWRRTVELDEPTWQLSRYNDVTHLDAAR
ncbi:MAG: histidine phosphatase family protein [Actinomycetia bacterium]|nr:histidine phosphatase family protein [Actinomycetes bacterium]